MAPLLDRVVRWVEREGADRLRPEVTVRAATMQVCASVLLRASSGELRGPLWGTFEDDWSLISALLFPDASASDAPNPTFTTQAKSS